MWTTYYFADKSELSRGNHVLDARQVVENFAYFGVAYAFFLDVIHREVEYASDIAVKEDFELAEK